MNASTIYQFIKTLPKNEWDLLMDMIEQDKHKFVIDNLFTIIPTKEISDDECINYLIENYFSKIRKK